MSRPEFNLKRLTYALQRTAAPSLSFWSSSHNNIPFSKLAITIILALFLFIGCKEKPKAVESKDKDEGRQNSKVLEAVDLVGYDGKRLRKTTDGVRHANDKRNRDIQKTIDLP